ncbi:MAG TPA: GMC family oxidoreductase [Terriglobia bacterium]|nr:GMC family oxidoreductase [Terriglobia bacterium]
MPEIIRSPEVYDAVIVGSGAGGGIAAYVLTQAGAKCLMLEAGDWWDTAKQSTMMTWPYEAPHRGARTPEKPNGYFDPGYAGWELAGEPYVSAPGSTWRWWRSRMLGGRTNHWGRISLRMGPYDFKPYSRDGKGFDWPISYDDLAPYYDKTEELIGVFGSAEGLENTPDGKFLPPPKPRCYELMVQDACRKLAIPCVSSRLSILTRSIHGRAACHYCGQCGRSCATSSNFSSPTVLIPPAMATGNLKVICNAMGREVLVGDNGLATGVSYIDKKTRQEVQVRAKIVVLAASSCETARILLNSKNSRFPNGVANSTGMVGKYLMDTVGADGSAGFFPIMGTLPPHNEDGVGGMHLYMPWWNYQKQAKHQMPFSRGFHIEFGGGHGMPGGGFGGRHLGPGYGQDLKQRARKLYGAYIGFSCRGEMIPNEDSYCEIDNRMVDEWGIPVLKFHFKWSEDEIQMAKYARETFDEIIKTSGGEPMGRWSAENNWGISEGGEIIHEVGACRMGSDPKTAALNEHCQAWDCKNLFVTDGAPFVSNADKNPTLSIMALAWRTSEYAAGQVKKLNV